MKPGKIAAVIATRYEPPQLEPLVALLNRQGVHTVVMADFGPRPPDWSLYRYWNSGVRYAIEHGAEYVCVMNDDIVILPGTMHALSRWLLGAPERGVVYPDTKRWTGHGIQPVLTFVPTVGTWGVGGMTGFCFMFRADLDVPFDESYHLWYGDDAFEEAVRAKGLLVGRIDGIPIDHVPEGSTRRDMAVLGPMIAQDRHRWETRLERAA